VRLGMGASVQGSVKFQGASRKKPSRADSTLGGPWKAVAVNAYGRV